MSNINVINTPTYLVIKNSGRLEVRPTQVQFISIAKQGPRGAQGIQGETGPHGGGLNSVQEDPDPHLGGHLILGAYNIVGQLENDSLILDGGLM